MKSLVNFAMSGAAKTSADDLLAKMAGGAKCEADMQFWLGR